VRLEERHPHPTARQQEPQHQAGRPAAHDATIRLMYSAYATVRTRVAGPPRNRDSAVSGDGQVYALLHDIG
jgi:hypothetical protein